MSISQIKQISIGLNVKLTRILGQGPSTQTTTLMEENQLVNFESYSEGSVVLEMGVSNYPLLQDSELVLLQSDLPIDVIINPGEAQVVIPSTRRFSIDSSDGVSIHLSNLSETEKARVSFLTTNKPTPVA